MTSAADRYREDSLWTKYRQIKGVLDGASANSARDLVRLYDDSGRVVDMSEVQTNLFVGSE